MASIIQSSKPALKGGALHLRPTAKSPVSTPRYLRANGRTCHIVDIENLVGSLESRHIYSDEVRAKVFTEVSSGYQRKWVHSSDLVYVGCDAAIMYSTALDWEHYSVRFGRGKDGADRALMEVIDIDAVARSCDVLQIASGDHAFADLARLARSEGLFVRAVARSGQLSRELRENCDAIYTMA